MMPRHDDIFDFSPKALERVQCARLDGVSHCYIGTEWPNVVYFFGLETEPGLRGKGRYQAYAKKLDEHCDATGVTRIAEAMSRGEIPFERLVETYRKHGFEVVGEVRNPGTAYPSASLRRQPRMVG
jgi:GNAT superfamily N-acetyltransferase